MIKEKTCKEIGHHDYERLTSGGKTIGRRCKRCKATDNCVIVEQAWPQVLKDFFAPTHEKNVRV